MASSYGRKKTFNEKMTDLKGRAKRAFILTAVGGAVIGGPLYYQYGTIKEQEVKIKEVKSEWLRYEEGKGSIYEYKIVTDRGMLLANENSFLHMKFNSQDIHDMLSEGRGYQYVPWNETKEQKAEREAASPANKVYKIRYYGARIDIPFIHTTPNILSVREVTPEELRARQEQRIAAERERQQAAGIQPGANGQPGTANGTGQVVTPAQPAATGLSGTMITFSTVVNGQKVEMTVPIEAADKITINKVTPIVPNAPAQPRGPGG